LRKADERTTEIRHKYEELISSHNDMITKIKKQEGQIEARDHEILRLGELYQGG
jgi:predicted nuclease with TOPRIM domain